jgi:hypothetical protein
MSRIISPFVAIIFIFAAPLKAAEGTTASAFMKCARIASDAQRLSCYDRLATELIELGLSSMTATQAPAVAPGAQAPATPVGGPGTAAPELEPAQSQAPAPPPPPAATQTPAPTTGNADVGQGPAAVARTEDQFGLERLDDEKRKDVKKIQSRYRGEFTGWSGKTIFRLENGQVWQQIESGRMSWKATNPMITINRGFMGSYQLSVEGVNKKVRVKRIE